MAASTEVRVNGYGIVKAVTSGDTIIVIGAPAEPNQPHPEKQISLTGIQAPRFSKSKNQHDEPFGYESREFLRKLLIGKLVGFYATGEAETRQYGTVYLGSESVNEMVVKAGYATVKAPPNGGKLSGERKALKDLEDEAIAAKIGMHRAVPHAVRTINWNPDARATFARFKNQEVPAVVMQVRDGSVLRCEVRDGRPESNSFMIVALALAGARSNRVPMSLGYRQAEHKKKTAENEHYDGEAPEPEEALPFANEAVAFVERRLLNRDIKIKFLGADKAGNMFGTILYREGDITARLLETGLAKFVEWTSQVLPESQAVAYRALSEVAKEKSLGMWSVDEDEEAKVQYEKITSKVVFIQSGDLIVCEDGDKEVKYSLASVRARRGGNARRGEKDQPYAAEAREFLRKKLIGKKVTIQPEYTRTSPAGIESIYASVFVGNENMSESLVQAGLAEVIPHRQDEARSSNYVNLLGLEFDATQSGLGIHSKAPYKAPSVVDFSIRAPKGKDKDTEEKVHREAGNARQYVGFFQRDKQINGVVEYCFSASRLKVFVPKHNCMIVLVLAGIRTPTAGEPFSAEANKYVKSRVLQHSVRIEVETCDKGDNFIGSLFFNNQNIAVKLLEEGLASVFGYSASRSPYYSELITAEAAAKEAKLKIWENYVPTENTEDSADGEEAMSGVKDQMQVQIVDVTDVTSFYVRVVNDPNVSAVEKAMEEYNASPDENPLEKPAKGSIIAAKYPADEQWYRVRYEGPSGKEHKVFFLDFGNPELLPKDRLAALPPAVAKLPGLARPCLLSGLRGPSKASEHYHDAAVAFNSLAYDRTLNAKMDLIDRNNKLHLTLTDPEDESEEKISINQILLQDGWCRVLERPDRKLAGLCKTLQADENIAKNARLNIWEYGDVSDDEIEEDPNVKPKNDGRPPSKRVAAAK